MSELISFRGIEIPRSEAKALQELEKLIAKQLPLINLIIYNTFGVTIEDNKIVGLGLYGCNLSNVPDTIKNFKNLVRLNIGANSFTELPEFLENLTKLSVLYLNFNDSELILSESIKNLTSLKELHAGGCNINSLPNSIGNLESLEVLDLHRNKLRTIPESIGSLLSLRKLDLRYNDKLFGLPLSLINLNKIENIDLRANPRLTFKNRDDRLVLKVLKKRGVTLHKDSEVQGWLIVYVIGGLVISIISLIAFIIYEVL